MTTAELNEALSYHELYKMCREVPGEIVDCGTGRGDILCLLAMLRGLFSNTLNKSIISFGSFPKHDGAVVKDKLLEILKQKNCGKNVIINVGDPATTVPEYIGEVPYLTISMLHMNIEGYNSSANILDWLLPMVIPGGIVCLSNYGKSCGETDSINELIEKMKIKLRKFPFSYGPVFFVK